MVLPRRSDLQHARVVGSESAIDRRETRQHHSPRATRPSESKSYLPVFQEASMPRTHRLWVAIAVATLLPLGSATARTIDVDAATIADINAAFDAGTLTSEALTRMCLARIDAFDRNGPTLHAVIFLNPRALEQARALDAAYAVIGMGTDTGGSIRGPATTNGIAALKPTHGLLSRSGIIPLALSFDTGGPMARSVFDVAAALGIMTGVDAADPATAKSEAKFQTGYTAGLRVDALNGARIGVARDFMGADPDVDWVMEAAFSAMRKAGATLVDVRYPKWLLDVKGEFYTAIRYPEFAVQIAEYLKGTGPKYPKTLGEMIERANQFTGTRGDGARPNPSRWTLFKREVEAGSMTDYRYTAVHDYGLPMVRALGEGMFEAPQLDAMLDPTASRRPSLITATAGAGTTVASALSASGLGATDIANLTGFPALIVPAGFTGDSLPVGLSFFGRAFGESKLLSLGYSFEQATKARRRPVHTPALPGETISMP